MGVKKLKFLLDKENFFLYKLMGIGGYRFRNFKGVKCL